MPGAISPGRKSLPVRDGLDRVRPGLARNRIAKPFVSVIVPTLDEERHIWAALESITDISPELDYEVLVMDGGSSDATREIVLAAARRNGRIRWYPNPKRLQSAAVNQAEQLADPRAATIVRADCHALYPPGFVATCLAKMAETGASAIVVPLHIVGETCVQRAVAALQSSLIGNGGGDNRPARHSRFVDQGHHAAFDRKLFRQLGGYDETFSHNEDTDLDVRIRGTGGRIWLEASIPVTYFPRGTIRGLAQQYFDYGKGRAHVSRKHHTQLRLRQLLPPVTFGVLLGCLASAPLIPWLLLGPSAYIAACLAAGMIDAVRRHDPCLLLVGPAAVILHISWVAGLVVGWAHYRHGLHPTRRVTDGQSKTASLIDAPAPLQSASCYPARAGPTLKASRLQHRSPGQ